ncbi:hypothetical protein MRX96_012880 [Rhipicephalus microplus]
MDAKKKQLPLEVDPELLEADGDEDDEWEDVEIEEIYPALANLELGEQIVHYQPYQMSMPSATKYLHRQVSLIMGTLVMAAISTTAICKEDPSPYPSCLEGFQQTPVQFLYHKIQTRWIAVVGLLVAVIGFFGALGRSKRLLAMYQLMAPLTLLPIIFILLRFAANALSKAFCETVLSFFEAVPLFRGMTSLWVPVTWTAPLLVLSLIGAVKLYGAEDAEEELEDEEEDVDELPMNRQRG